MKCALAAAVGAVAGLVITLIPGVADGWLLAGALGAAAGATIAVIGSMTHAGIPGARQSISPTAAEARVLDAQANIDIRRGGEEHRRSGWSSFEANAPNYIPGEGEPGP